MNPARPQLGVFSLLKRGAWGAHREGNKTCHMLRCFALHRVALHCICFASLFFEGQRLRTQTQNFKPDPSRLGLGGEAKGVTCYGVLGCYAMLRYATAMLCFAMPCCAMLMLCFAMLCHAVLC